MWVYRPETNLPETKFLLVSIAAIGHNGAATYIVIHRPQWGSYIHCNTLATMVNVH